MGGDGQVGHPPEAGLEKMFRSLVSARLKFIGDHLMLLHFLRDAVEEYDREPLVVQLCSGGKGRWSPPTGTPAGHLRSGRQRYWVLATSRFIGSWLWK